MCVVSVEEDIDGVPLEGESEGLREEGAVLAAGFVPSRWETVEPGAPGAPPLPEALDPPSEEEAPATPTTPAQHDRYNTMF